MIAMIVMQTVAAVVITLLVTITLPNSTKVSDNKDMAIAL